MNVIGGRGSCSVARPCLHTCISCLLPLSSIGTRIQGKTTAELVWSVYGVGCDASSANPYRIINVLIVTDKPDKKVRNQS